MFELGWVIPQFVAQVSVSSRSAPPADMYRKICLVKDEKKTNSQKRFLRVCQCNMSIDLTCRSRDFEYSKRVDLAQGWVYGPGYLSIHTSALVFHAEVHDGVPNMFENSRISRRAERVHAASS